MIDLRAATLDDASDIAHIYAPYVATNAVSFEEKAPSSREMRHRMTAQNGLYPWIVACPPGAADVVIGYAYGKSFRPGPAYRFSVEVAVYAGADMEGQGVRRQLLSSLIATLTAQDFAQAIVTLTTPNDKLIQLYEAGGFRRAGQYREIAFKNGRWNDVGLWQRELAEPNSPPDEPKPFAEVGVVRN
jgi:L-amino acid N-acyltransferase YncA